MRLIVYALFWLCGVSLQAAKILEYKFWEQVGATSFRDSSGSGLTATCSGGSCPTVLSRGKFESSLKFDGTSDYLDAGSSNTLKELAETAFTISVWFSRAAIDSSDDILMGNAWSTPGWHIRITTANKIRAIVLTDGSNNKTSDTGVLTKEHNHVVAVWDTSDVTTYLNGASDSSQITSGTLGSLTSTNNCHVGNLSGDTKYFNGRIHKITIWNSALSREQLFGSPRKPSIDLPSSLIEKVVKLFRKK